MDTELPVAIKIFRTHAPAYTPKPTRNAIPHALRISQRDLDMTTQRRDTTQVLASVQMAEPQFRKTKLEARAHTSRIFCKWSNAVVRNVSRALQRFNFSSKVRNMAVIRLPKSAICLCMNTSIKADVGFTHCRLREPNRTEIESV